MLIITVQTMPGTFHKLTKTTVLSPPIDNAISGAFSEYPADYLHAELLDDSFYNHTPSFRLRLPSKATPTSPCRQ